MERKRILFAEDNEHDVRLAMETLAVHRMADAVALVRDGAEALDYLFRRGAYSDLPEELPDVVFLDLRMPKVGGLEVLAQVKGDPRLSALRVVMLTASRAEADILQSYALGASAYVVKPVQADDLRDAVGTLGIFWAIHNEPPPQCASGEPGQTEH